MPLLPPLTPENYPRELWGMRFRYPQWWEWLVLLGAVLLAFSGWLDGWLGLLIVAAWGAMFFRTGLILNHGKPLRLFLLFGLFITIMNLSIVALAVAASLVLKAVQ